jgi:hypothetical protein
MLHVIDEANKRNLLLSMIFLATAGSIPAAASRITPYSPNSVGEPATLTQGNLTAALRHQAFGGDNIGSFSVILSKQKVDIYIHLHKLPESGNIFEAQFLDTTTNSTLVLGQVSGKITIPINGNIMNLFRYNQTEPI